MVMCDEEAWGGGLWCVGRRPGEEAVLFITFGKKDLKNICSELQVQLASIPFGVIPLGKENRFYTSQHLQRPMSEMPAK